MRAIVTGGAGQNLDQGIEFQWMDLVCDDAAVKLPTDGADVIRHLASNVRQELSFEWPTYSFKENTLLTQLLVQWRIRNRVKQMVFASTMNVYGQPRDIQRVSETTPVQPPSPYSVGKLTSEHLCDVYQQFAEVKTTCLRVFNAYGPIQDMLNTKQRIASVFVAFVARGEPVHVRGSKERFRDFVYSDDVVDAFIRRVGEHAYGKIFKVSTGIKTHVHALFEAIIPSYGLGPATYPITFGAPTPRDQFGIYGDSSRLQRELAGSRLFRWRQAGAKC